uniref:Uncharacterized protein n=1 Tax=Caenorhabditis tropicalis TaxID=1561998 RepID=A0A1I7UBB1_9PELO
MLTTTTLELVNKYLHRGLGTAALPMSTSTTQLSERHEPGSPEGEKKHKVGELGFLVATVPRSLRDKTNWNCAKCVNTPDIISYFGAVLI